MPTAGAGPVDAAVPAGKLQHGAQCVPRHRGVRAPETLSMGLRKPRRSGRHWHWAPLRPTHVACTPARPAGAGGGQARRLSSSRGLSLRSQRGQVHVGLGDEEQVTVTDAGGLVTGSLLPSWAPRPWLPAPRPSLLLLPLLWGLHPQD